MYSAILEVILRCNLIVIPTDSEGGGGGEGVVV